MQLASFLNKVFKKGGFILTDANSKDYIIGNPGNNPIKLKILNKNLHYKLLLHPDLYFDRCESIVLRETPSSDAISLEESPSAISPRTSRSRSVSTETPEGPPSPGRAMASTTCCVIAGDRYEAPD